MSELGPVYIVCGKTDLRKGKSDRFKALYWDGEGFWLLYKRFENGQLAWPRSTTEVQALTPEQVEWLMKGFSITPKILESQSRHFY
ncbi:IS66 family insertion sequence element accessory protein TnpB [Enterococcus cecorum]|uniref:IS66 family insertion sequence element accessory protein TnpB n=1 Tax=Enterococcus cecorum TaxID=44008 RepID=UPI001E4FD0BB|nr:IS66 family insertion sequence element accessory protein TnpB [Enterococcus cecorum]